MLEYFFNKSFCNDYNSKEKQEYIKKTNSDFLCLFLAFPLHR